MNIPEAIGIILLIVTSHGKMDNGKPTGLWLEEFAVPYEIFHEAGYEVIVASPEGGQAPIDPRSLPENPTEKEAAAIALLKNTRQLDADMLNQADGVFFAGGHGTMFDFPNDKTVQQIVSKAVQEEIPLGLVCHGPAALVGATDAEGNPVVNNRKVTGFTNEEEEAVNLTEEMPFLLETKLKEQGAEFSAAEKFQTHTVVDGKLVTGQNPPSSRETAKALLKMLED